VNATKGAPDRAQVCRWLHDGPLQVFNYIAAGGYADDISVDELRRVAAQAADDMRAYLDNDLARESESLVSALDEAVTDAQLLAPGLDVRLIAGPMDADLDAESVRELAAAAREALTNVRKHSAARHATVRCEQRGSRVVVRVADDGTGFTPEPGSAGRGIRGSMMRRMRDIGGSAFIESSPGRGTSVRLVLDLKRSAGMPIHEEIPVLAEAMA
jgi:signal transduction histidine kinase